MLNILKSIDIKLPHPSIQPVRYKQSFTRRPRPPHFWAKKMLVVLKPVLPKPFDHNFPPHLKCRKYFELNKFKNMEENPYERILANEVMDEIRRSKMILILHCNPMSGYHFYRSKVTFQKEGMTLFRNSRQTVSMAVAGTAFSPIIRLFETKTLLLCCPEVNVHRVYALLKTMPFYILLAGIVENKFLSRNTLNECSKFSDINAARAQIAHSLISPAAHLAHNVSLYRDTLEPDSK